MIGVSYTITPATTDDLIAIDSLRRTILTTPLTPLDERKLRWQATIHHIVGSISLSGTDVTAAQITAYLLHPSRHPGQSERMTTTYKKILDWFTEVWTGNTKPLTLSFLDALARVLLPERIAVECIRAEESDLRHLLSYIHSQSDHPILRTAVIHGQLASTDLSRKTNGMFPRLVSALLLAKYGYDCRGMLALDPYWKESGDRYTRAYTSIERLGQLTAWLEYYTAVTKTCYESLESEVLEVSGNTGNALTGVWQMSEREMELLRALESPTMRVTNRDVQHKFRISQVTASRTLTRLVSLGLLYVHGKGRSVFYTKA